MQNEPIPNSTKYLIPHALHEHLTFEQYCKRLPEIFFKEKVPEDVVKSFEVIERLLAHSYFEYRFIDEAYHKALETLEMAMFLRLKELGKLKKKSVYFPELSEKLISLNQLDADPRNMKILNQMRNHYAHPRHHSFGGAFLWGHIQSIIFLINQLYEEVNIRLDRRLLEKEFNDKQVEMGLKNKVVLCNKEKLIPLYQLSLALINNKELPIEYHFCWTPLFNLETEHENGVINPKSFILKVVNPIFQNNHLLCLDCFNQKQSIIAPVATYPELQEDIDEWFSRLNSKNQQQRWMYDNAVQRNTGEIAFESYWDYLKK